ncbi:MAG: hypothetical protein KF693_19245 [Nitrospira sp.]|nr:hypothetical protein [Nitrospira sp.]
MEQKNKVYMYQTAVKWTAQRKGLCRGKVGWNNSMKATVTLEPVIR